MQQIIKVSDFTGSFSIATDQFTQEDILNYIENNYKEYFYELFGAKMTDDFLADLVAGIPTTQKYLDIFNPFSIDIKDSDCGCSSKYIASRGIKFWLLSNSFFDYVRDFGNQIGIQSIGRKNDTDLTNSNLNDNFLKKNYNKAIDTGKAIQYKIEKNSTSYPDYNGKLLNYISI